MIWKRFNLGGRYQCRGSGDEAGRGRRDRMGAKTLSVLEGEKGKKKRINGRTGRPREVGFGV